MDHGKGQIFEVDGHYQWTKEPEAVRSVDSNRVDDQLAFEDIMIGYRESYGGYQRILKEYRSAGIDPAQRAIYERQQTEKEPQISPVPDSPKEPEKILNHVRKQSKEALRGITRSTRSVFSLNKK